MKIQAVDARSTQLRPCLSVVITDMGRSLLLQLFVTSHGKLRHLQPEQQLFVLRKMIEAQLRTGGDRGLAW